ncbi:hypothetical protein JCM6882_008800 [Rhodosporidiobolus microsporus]
MDDDGQLADPSDMTPQQRTSSLVQAVEADDLVGVLLFLVYSVMGEVNGQALHNGLTPLGAALVVPLRRFEVRRLIVECLLHHGADIAQAEASATRPCSQELLTVLHEWDHGGREQALLAMQLRESMTLEEAEAYILNNGLGVDDLPPIPSTSAAVLPPPRSPYSPRRGRSRSRSVERERSRGPPERRSRSPPRRRSPSPGPSRRRDSPRYRSRSRTRYRKELRRTPPRSSPRRPSPSSTSRSRRSSPPPRDRSPARPAFLPESTHWIYVTDIPLTRSERFVFEKLGRRGIDVGDCFLTTASGGFKRQAYVGVYSDADADEAVRLFQRLVVDGKTLHANRFRDPSTGATSPRQLPRAERRYVPPEVQLRRPPNSRRLGLFILHVPPQATQNDVGRFLERSLSPREIGSIAIKYAGAGTQVFVDLQNEEAGRRAILDLDGELIGGLAVRVAWRDLDPDCLARIIGADGAAYALSRFEAVLTSLSAASRAPLPPPRDHLDHSTSSSNGASFDQSALSSTNLQPLTKNRYAALAANSSHNTSSPPAPSSSEPPVAVDTFTQSPRPLENGDAKPASNASKDVDLAQLEALGLPASTLSSLQQRWAASDDPPLPSSSAATDGDSSRTVEGRVSFGFLPSEQAQAALEANKREPGYPHDPVMQNRYEAFLRAQTGESKDWYTVFFAQLVNFNRSAKSFAEKGGEAARLRIGAAMEED